MGSPPLFNLKAKPTLSGILVLGKLTGIMRVTANVEAADVASSLAPLTVKALAVLALLAPSVAKADRKTAFDLEEPPPRCYVTTHRIKVCQHGNIQLFSTTSSG